eukprot:CAMPEP_0204613290 /NCGR_PEP_ID=MMETSP0717-20131115/1266_1 /ASSEMBLY_ACC=CAM_ASM_000666 /TAXON_ID=230516 /ORGANISM="Chaetoceros curvisetus" /LENGTH=253 /DNA_ID=CAMNT_0051625657 /DNA_START=38 /DNA_END=803 /DNA_ORIENTATION=-
MALSATGAMAWTTAPMSVSRTSTSTSTSTSLPMALDYNDPIVAEEFNAVQPLTYDEVEEELMMSGISGSPDMNEMDLKLMLVEYRLMLSGKLKNGGKDKKEVKPDSYSTKFEEALWEKPFFQGTFEDLKAKGDHNSQNVAAEYLNDPENAKVRYGKEYRRLIADIDAALSAKKEVTSPVVTFKGFPANMGEMGCKMTLEALGEIAEFECAEDEDFPVLVGTVTFEDVETAKKAIEQYDGMDMGMGQALELESV